MSILEGPRVAGSGELRRGGKLGKMVRIKSDDGVTSFGFFSSCIQVLKNIIVQ